MLFFAVLGKFSHFPYLSLVKKIKLSSVSYSYLKNLPDFHFQRLNNFLTSSHIYNFPFFNLFSAFETS